MTRLTPEREASVRWQVEALTEAGLADANDACALLAEVDALRADVALFHGRATVLEIERNAAEMARENLRADVERLARIEAAARAMVEAVDASGCQRGRSIRVLAEALGMGEPLSAP